MDVRIDYLLVKNHRIITLSIEHSAKHNINFELQVIWVKKLKPRDEMSNDGARQNSGHLNPQYDLYLRMAHWQ